MLTKEQVLDRAGVKGSRCLDGRDFTRLACFFTPEDWPRLGLKLADGADRSAIETKDWTRENILAQMEQDVAFGFEKALGQRGISASLMNEVVKMWLYVLEDDIAETCGYTQYGLPLLKAVAVKYGFENPIGGDVGDEDKYAMVR